MGLEETSVEKVKGIGAARARQLERLGIRSVDDLLNHLPRRYQDMRQIVPLAQVKLHDTVTVRGQIIAVQERRAQYRQNLILTKAILSDGSGQLNLIWFTRGWRTPSYIRQQVKVGATLTAYGQVETDGGQLLLKNPIWEAVSEENSLHTGRLVPVYPLTQNLPVKILRRAIWQALDDFGPALADVLPASLVSSRHLMPRPAAVRQLHFPDSWEQLERARRRVIFEEFFLLQLGLAVRKRWLRAPETGISHRDDGTLMEKFYRLLPYQLTRAQKRAISEIFADMEAPRPMQRLIQGDVGSGKTLVAAAALVKTAASGYQGALMAPTEILAEQHYASLGEKFAALGIRAALLTGGLPPARREEIIAGLASGEIQIVIGTQALIQEAVAFARLGLAVVDEQHRFGVRQRAAFKEKGQAPDLLVMTATPIPRTLALCVYGDLDITVLDELPPGRRPVLTKFVSSGRREKVYAFIKGQVAAGRQAYIIYPLVEETETSQAGAVEAFDHFRQGAFAGFSLGLLHGRLSPEEKEATMRAFRDGRIQILVATTVVEVGVNVPNATVMVVEEADRFGLAQLHQLRGRVGRGQDQSYCILIADPATPEARARMQAMIETADGFRIAEADLRLRGPGEFFGTRQHGLPELRVADLTRDLEQLVEARKAAFALVQADPDLSSPEHKKLRDALLKRFGERLALADLI
ncbi:MAG: ATP-dependent DNA helicase RecG [Syntrophothermus sp.]